MQRQTLTRLLDLLGNNEGICTVIGTSKRVHQQTAALINGMSAHVAEMDDGTRFGMMHPGAPVISALLAITEEKRLDGTALIRGLITGYEAAIALSSAIQPGHKEKGYHATGTCGSVGAACGVVAALGGKVQDMEAAIAAAATGAGGLLKAIDDDSELKPLNVGRAAQNGLVAALVALAGFSPPCDVLGAHRGFFSVLAGAVDETRLIPSSSESLSLHRVYMKPYAACRHCHPSIEAALLMCKMHSISPESIQGITVNTYKWAVAGHDHVVAESVSSAKMSIPFSVAAAIVCKSGGMEAFSPELLVHPEILRLAKSVIVRENPSFTDMVPEKRPAEVHITTSYGSFSHLVELPKGEPETALRDDEVKEKFISLCTFGKLSRKGINKTIDTLYTLEETGAAFITTLRMV